MAYKYDSTLKHFTYSKESYKIISDFLLSGEKSNPNILLNVTNISQDFGKRPNDWFAISTTVSFVKALIRIKIQNNNSKKLKHVVLKFIHKEMSDTSKNGITQNTEVIEVLNGMNNKQLLKLMKEIGLIAVKKGNLDS